MTRNKLWMLAGASLLAVVPTVAQAQRQPREVGYFLPRVRVGAVVQELILRCPTDNNRIPHIATNIVISGEARPDPERFINVDARSGFLASRTTKLGLRADGTLTSFNATTEGQGGEVLSAVIGLASTVASFGFGVPAIPATSPVRESRLTCNPRTEERVTEMHRLETELESLLSRIATGGESEGSARALTELTAELADVVGELTLETSARFDPDRSDFAGSSSPQPKAIQRVAYDEWFTQRHAELDNGLNAAEVRGRFGYLATLTPDRAIFDALAGDGRPFPASGESTPYLFYRRPVPATVVVSSCGARVQNDACPLATGDGAISKRETVSVPQLSGPFSIPIGRGGIFGTQSAAATFDEQGAPLTLEYGSTSGGAAIAGVINAGGTALTTIRDAENTAITRRLAREEALAKLAELLDEPAPAAGQ